MHPVTAILGKSRRSFVLPFACLVITIIILLAGLWPLEFFPKNQVSWIVPGGVRFNRPGMAYSAGPVFGAGLPLQPGSPITVEFAVRPAKQSGRAVASLLTLFDSQDHDQLVIGQWKSQLIVRVGTPRSRNEPYTEESTGNTLGTDIVTFITITSHQTGTTIYVDGQSVKEAPDYYILPTNSHTKGILLLGNSPTGKHQWRGDLLFLTFHDRILPSSEVAARFREWSASTGQISTVGDVRILEYKLNEQSGQTARNSDDSRYDIVIPPHFRALWSTVLALPWHERVLSRSFVSDVTINLVGFLPFGFAFASWFQDKGWGRSRYRIIWILLLGAGVSLLIELLQFYLPTRTSSLTDVLCNTLGAGLGAGISEAVINRALLLWKES